MLTGTNVLRLNQATMCEALRVYLTRNVFSDGALAENEMKVDSVKETATGSGYSKVDEYEITVTCTKRDNTRPVVDGSGKVIGFAEAPGPA